MKVRVEYDELEYVTKNTDEDKSELEIEIDKLLASLERIKDMWQGTDADIYYDKAFEYINRMKVLSGFMDTTSELMKFGMGQYQKQDQSFSRDLNKEVNDNEPDRIES